MLFLLFSSAPVGQVATVPPAEPTLVGPTDRLAWRQSVPSIELAYDYVFAAYVDGQVGYLRDTVCEPAPDEELAVECTAALPPLTAGQHQIAITALNNAQDRLESAPSDPILVMASSAISSTSRQSNPAGIDGAFARVLVSDLDQPIDIAVVRPGLVVVAQRDGRMFAIHHDDHHSERPQEWIGTNGSDGELLTIATTSSHLFAVYAGKGTATLVRYAVAANGLTDQSIVLDGLPVRANNPSAVLRRGPDGKVYLALGADAGDATTGNDVGSWRGKVLRLNADGTLPHDEPSVVFGASASDPRDLVWHDLTLWLLAMGDNESVATFTPVRPFWQTEQTVSRGVSLPAAFPARSVVALPAGDLVVVSASLALTLRVVNEGPVVANTVEPAGLDGIVRMTADLSRVYFLTTSSLFVRPIVTVR